MIKGVEQPREQLSHAGNGASAEGGIRQSCKDRAYGARGTYQPAGGGAEAGLPYWRRVRSTGEAGEDDEALVVSRWSLILCC